MLTKNKEKCQKINKTKPKHYLNIIISIVILGIISFTGYSIHRNQQMLVLGAKQQIASLEANLAKEIKEYQAQGGQMTSNQSFLKFKD